MHVGIFWRCASSPIKDFASVILTDLLLVFFNRAQGKTRMSHLIRVYAAGAHLVTKSLRFVFSVGKHHSKPSMFSSHCFSDRLLKKKQMTREPGKGKPIILTPAKVGCVLSCSTSVYTQDLLLYMLISIFQAKQVQEDIKLVIILRWVPWTCILCSFTVVLFSTASDSLLHTCLLTLFSTSLVWI